MIREAKTENGYVRGLPAADPRITAFKGVPYAAPPVGDNRWRAPRKCASWEGVRDAFAFAPIPVQDTPGLGDDLYCREWHVDPRIPMSEDCLYLNIWTGAADASEKRPVLLWFYGGGFQWGYTAEMEFDGERLARRGIVVVTAAYRLGAFGFLAHPEITEESPEAPSNFGLLDQRAALTWVSRNIAAFGGDPDAVTIAGQSAGGGSVMHQLACRENFPLIKGAAILSGMICHPKDEQHIFRPVPLKEAERQGKAFFASMQVKSLAEARDIDAGTLLENYNAYVKDHPRMFPNMDGQFCRENPMQCFMQGKSAPVPILAGNTEDEFMLGGENIVEKSVKQAFLAAERAGSTQRHYYYRFTPDIPGSDSPGTFHSCDLWFFFETLAKCSRPYTGRHYDLARQMSDSLAAFVRTGDPGMAWKPYTDHDRAQMEFTGAGAVICREGGIRLGQTGRKQAVNPYLPSWEYVPDGEPYVFGDRIYVYGSHDLYDGETFCLGDYVCWSAPVNDLGSWHYEGVIYRKTDDPMNADGAMCLYAPDVTVGPDGRYYLYYVLDHASVVSVAAASTPAGPFSFLGYVRYPDGTRLGEKPGDEPQFDPGVLTEGDVTYLYTGFCPKGDEGRTGAMLTILGPDMLTVQKAPRFVTPGCCYSAGTSFEGHAFFEASSIRKVDGKYCFIYSSEVMHELCYAVSDSPEGPFAFQGVLVSNCDLHLVSGKPADMSMAYGANNHGSIVQIGGIWYIFYHRHTNGTWFSRQGCAEKLPLREDGLFGQAEMTSCGLNDGPLCDAGEYPAYIACNLFTDRHAVYVEKDAPRVRQTGGDAPGGGISTGSAAGEGVMNGVSYLTGMTDTACAGFKYFMLRKAVGLRVRTRGYFRGRLEVRLSFDGPLLGSITIDHSNIWKTRECFFPPVSGKHALFLTCRGEGQMSLLSFEFLHGAS